MFLNHRTIGLDISDDAVYVIKLKGKNKGSIKIESLNRRSLKKGIVEDGRIKNKEALAEAIKEVLHSAKPKKIKGREVICCLPESKIFTYVFSFPKELDKKQIKTALENERKEVIPLEPEESYDDFNVVYEGEDMKDVFFAATEKELVNDYIEVLGGLNLNIKAFDMESAGLARALIKDPQSEEASLILDIGGRTSIMSIFDKNGIQMTYNMDIAGDSITRDITSKLKISEEKAEERKKKEGLGEKAPQNLKKAIQGSLRPVFKEAQKTITYYEHKNNRKVKDVILCGGTSKMTGFIKFATSELDKEKNVVMGDPLLYLDKNSLPIGKSSVIDYSTVIGLALRPFFGNKNLGVNFLPKKKFIDKIKNIFTMPKKKTKKTDKEQSAPKSDKSPKDKKVKDEKTSEGKVTATKTPKDKKTDGESFFNRYKATILAIIAIVAILAAAIVIYFTLIDSNFYEKAPEQNTSESVVTTEPVDLDFEITVQKISDEELPAGVIPGFLFSEIYEESGTFRPETTEEVPGTATGTVILVNESSQRQSLVATTRLLSEEGVLFRLSDAVNIPAGEELEAEVYADEEGEEGNIGPTTFTIPGLSESMREVIYARSEESMSGGIKEVGILNLEDLEEALQSLMLKAKESALEDIESGEDFVGHIIIPELIRADISDSEVDGEVGEQVDEFEVTATIEIQALLFPEGPVVEAARQEIESEYGEESGAYIVESYDYSVEEFDSFDEAVDISVSADLSRVE